MNQPVHPVPQDVWNQFSCRHYGLDPQKVVYLYLPESAQNGQQVPLAILVHGGNFLNGSATEDKLVPLARYFMEQGYAVASIEYRTLRQHDWPTPVEDVRDGIGYIFRSLGGYIESTTYVGYSAGAVIGALLLYSGQYGEIDGIDRFVGLSGLYNTEATSEKPIQEIREQSQEGINLLEMTAQIQAPQSRVPALLVEGSQDYFVDQYPFTERSHAEQMKALLNQAGIPAQTFWGVGANYNDHNGPIALFSQRDPTFITTLEAFLKQPDLATSQSKLP